MPDGVRTAVVGVSVSPTCGVRDHAALLAQALEARGYECSMHWLTRQAGTLARARAECGAWTRALDDEIERERAQAILLHYSVFSYSYKGLPLFVHPAMAALRRTQLPIVAVMHELAFPLRKEGARGAVWALSQRAALIEVVRACSSIALTADFRVQWLDSRRWLPRRPLELTPVFSNLPAPAPRPPHDGELVGLFGYRYDGGAIARVLDALALLRAARPGVRLRLLGGPGPASASGEQWSAAASSRGVADALSFSGMLAAQELSDELAECDVLIFTDTPGPSSRKGTLAGALASGRPLVATGGHRQWSELTRQGAALVVGRSAEALAEAVGALLANASEREALGTRGREFAQREMGIARTVEAVERMLTEAQRSTA